MRVLIAPQEFKGSLTAAEAANAMAAGIRRARPDWTLDLVPMADGGPGFLAAIHGAQGGHLLTAAVHDPIGRPVRARYLLLPGQPRVVVVEAAQANGLLLLAANERDPLRADTYGVGELILAVAEARPARILIGVGGSATTDGGAGMARAFGARFWSMDGRELEPGGAALAGLARLDWRRPPTLDGIEVVVATDVTNPLIGPNGAAAIYGPQKGATPDQVDSLEAALTTFALVVRRALGVEIASLPGVGAAGGLAAGLVAFLGAKIVSGFDVVAEATGLAARVAQADYVVTGEGSFDSQSLQGKTTGRVVGLAKSLGKPTQVFAGRAEARLACATLMSLEPEPATAMARAGELLAQLAANWAGARP